VLADQRGWEVFLPFGIVVDHERTAYGVATVQHKLARSLGGTNDSENLTLYCYNCNNADDKEVKKQVTVPILPGNDPLPRLRDGFRNRRKIGETIRALSRWEDDGGRPRADPDSVGN
jgi:hypothetical protein